MRIVAIRDIVSPIRSNIANAYIDFSQMTASVVAIETDLEVEGKPVDRLRLQLQRPLCPARAAERALHSAR